jgi:hypothetical protein
MAHGFITGVFHTSFDNGHSFEQFAKNYGKQYGAYIMARDESSDFEITDAFWEPCDYHMKAIQEAEAILSAHESGVDDDMQALFEAEKQKRLAEASKDIAEIQEQIAMAESWRECANRMRPATPDHEQLVTAMRNQIDETIRECINTLRYAEKELLDAESLECNAWANERITQAIQDIEYHRGQHAQEVARQQARKAWHEAFMAMIADANKEVA